MSSGTHLLAQPLTERALTPAPHAAQVDFSLAHPPDPATCAPGSALKGVSEVARALGLARRLLGT
jgi:hypothetical protein